MAKVTINKKRLFETISNLMEQEQEAASGGFPSKAPKNMPRTESEGPTPDEVVAKFAQLAPGAPKDHAKQLAQIGGEDVLKQNYIELTKKFAGSSSNPERIKMPVVDPDKADADIADDGGDLGRRMAKGQLDLKPPYTKEPPFTKENIQRMAKMVVERLAHRGLITEENLDDIFPQGLDKDKAAGEKFLTKGERDGSDTDDSAVTMKKDTIPVSKIKPSQKQIYVDKSLWNILKFGGTKPGATAFGDADMIAIDVGGEYVVLDGHHRWSSAYLSGGPTATVNVQVIDGLDVAESIAALRAYGNARGNVQKA